MRTAKDIIENWFKKLELDERILDGTMTDHEVLGAITGMPPEAFAFIEQCRKIDVLAAKIDRWWNSLAPADRPTYMTMRQFQSIFGSDDTGAWQIGNALRQINWTSSRRRWQENAPRSRVWVPPMQTPVPL